MVTVIVIVLVRQVTMHSVVLPVQPVMLLLMTPLELAVHAAVASSRHVWIVVVRRIMLVIKPVMNAAVAVFQNLVTPAMLPIEISMISLVVIVVG